MDESPVAVASTLWREAEAISGVIDQLGLAPNPSEIEALLEAAFAAGWDAREQSEGNAPRP